MQEQTKASTRSGGSTARRDSNQIDRYTIYNYLEDIWYYGNMARTAWLDSGLSTTPLAATYLNNLVNHETGYDDDASGTVAPIEAFNHLRAV
jgi:hypothetical protein